MISIQLWILLSFIVLFGMLFVLSISSFISMIRMGKEYFKQVGFLVSLYKRIDTCYDIEYTTNYVYLGGKHFKTLVDSKFFFPIFEKDRFFPIFEKDRFFLIKYDNIFLEIEIFNRSEKGDWIPNNHKIKYISCIVFTLLFDRLVKKLYIIEKQSTKIDLDSFNSVLNQEITSLRRDDKLNFLLK